VVPLGRLHDKGDICYLRDDDYRSNRHSERYFCIGEIMRTYGRDSAGNWQEVTTDSNGWDDDVYLTTLAQVLQSDINESWVFPEMGIPARQSVVGRTHPDYFVDSVRAYFAQFFPSISITRTTDSDNNPAYYVDVLKNDGSDYKATIYV
jgi:hypothetical protein